MPVRNDYEVSSEAAVRHWEFTKTRLENTSPYATQPFAVTSLLPGTQITGTVLVSDEGDTVIIGDVTHSMVYKHYVRNVLTYEDDIEATWGAINEGDPIYYDGSATLPVDCFLSTAPLDNAGGANALFGFAVLANDADTYPKGAQTASTHEIAVMQEGS